MTCTSSIKQLTQEQTQRCREILSDVVTVEPRLPQGKQLPVSPGMFIRRLNHFLKINNIRIAHVFLEGSAASHCLVPDVQYNDLDIVFHLAEDTTYDHLCKIRDVLLLCLRRCYPSLATLDPFALSSCYLSKMFITPPSEDSSADQWALFTFAGTSGQPSLDLKFVQQIQRPFQFSINSFQIDLTPSFLKELESSQTKILLNCHCQYGDFDQCLSHLENKIIYVHSEDEAVSIHGGGLLKYAALKLNGYECAEEIDADLLEKYMCTRFQFDYQYYQFTRHGLPAQYQRIRDFICTHMAYKYKMQFEFLQILESIVKFAVGDQTGLLTNVSNMKQMLAQCMSQAYFSDQNSECDDAPDADDNISTSSEDNVRELSQSPPGIKRSQVDTLSGKPSQRHTSLEEITNQTASLTVGAQS